MCPVVCKLLYKYNFVKKLQQKSLSKQTNRFEPMDKHMKDWTNKNVISKFNNVLQADKQTNI